MRIMLVTRAWVTQRPGGMIHVAYDRAVELARQGYDTHVVTTSYSKAAGTVLHHEVAMEHGVTVHYTASPAHQWSPTFAGLCAYMHRDLQPDILHSESFDRDNWWWRGLPMSVTMHGFTFGAWLTDWNERRAYDRPLPRFPEEEVIAEATMLRSCKSVLAISKWEHRMLTDQYGLQPTLVYNPIGRHFFEQPRTDTPRKNFLCVAVSQGARRGFTVARRAASLAGVRLVTASNMSREGMVGMYDRAKALVLPTAFAQGYDLSIAEGRARGCPAIMTSTGSYLDEAAWWDKLVPIGDVGAVADAMGGPFLNVADAIMQHHPEEHVRNWLEAVS